jgi:hypothetical protein
MSLLIFVFIVIVVVALVWVAIGILPLPSGAPSFVKPLLYVLLLLGAALVILQRAGLLPG